MPKVYEVVAALGEYTDREGNTKVRWQNCGSVFEKDGKLSLKLDVIPTAPWDGWLKFFEPKQQQQASSRVNQGRDVAGSLDPNDQIPFHRFRDF